MGRLPDVRVALGDRAVPGGVLSSKKVVFAGNFGLSVKATMAYRSVPMARELAAAGHRPVLIVPPWERPDEAGTTERRWGIPVRNVGVGGGHAAITMRMLQAVLAERPDVVVAVKPKAYAGLLALLFGALRIPRLVVDTDDAEAMWSVRAGDPPPLRALVAWHERASLRVATTVMAASRDLERAARRDGARAVTYLPNATWPGAAGWPVPPRPDEREEPTLLLYSRLFEFDFDRLARVLRRVFDAVPRSRLLVVGAGLGGEEQELRRRLGRAALLDHCELVGWTPAAQLPELLRSAQVALVPLDDTVLNRARCSVKLLDLMLCGRAIVADGVGQVREYLRDGETGRVVPPGDALGMADAAIALLRDEGERGRLGAAAEREARSALTWERQRADVVRAVVGHS